MKAAKLKFIVIGIIIAVLCVGAVRLGEIHFGLPPLEIRPVQEGQTENVAAVSHESESGMPSIGGSFKLTDQNGNSRKDTDFRGKYMLVYFGYTFCPDICPTALYNISEALTLLGHKASKIQPIFITIDPERDTVEQLKLYKTNFDKRFVMLTGSVADIADIAKAYRVYYKKAKPDGTSTEYLVDHSSIVYVMDRQGVFVTHFDHQTPAEDIVRILTQKGIAS